jgi:hypothetical protein
VIKQGEVMRNDLARENNKKRREERSDNIMEKQRRERWLPSNG